MNVKKKCFDNLKNFMSLKKQAAVSWGGILKLNMFKRKFYLILFQILVMYIAAGASFW